MISNSKIEKNEEKRFQKAQNIRSVIRYLQKFKNALVVIYLDDEIISSPLFSSHMSDVNILHQAGIKVILVPGSRKRIDQVLSNFNLKSEFKNNIRITSEEAMPQIKMAAFDISNIVMTSLAAHQISATIGNWVRARAMGIIDGIDYGSAGVIDKLQTESIKAILDDGIIPIFPCIGWSLTGKPYNISSITLAEEIAISLKADKLFFLMNESEITSENFKIPENVGLSEGNDVPAMNLSELKTFLELNKSSEKSSESQLNQPKSKTEQTQQKTKEEQKKTQQRIIQLLKTAEFACKNGIARVHLVNGSIDGALPCEIFSDLGCGTMIYSQNYGDLRQMQREDIPAVLSLMRPFIQKKILLPRTEENLLDSFGDFIVYEIDGGIRACASLHVYTEIQNLKTKRQNENRLKENQPGETQQNESQGEIAAVAVDESFSNLGIGPMLIENLLEKAKTLKLKSVFILTTQTSDWFEKLGFKKDSVDSLPAERKKIWSPERNSKVLRIEL